jgi:hypothetical protein
MPFDPAEIGFEFSTEEIVARERELKGAIDSGRYYEYKGKRLAQTPRQSCLNPEISETRL